MSTDAAVPLGVDPTALLRDLGAAHDRFLATGAAGSSVRRVVADSWRRSLAGGLDPERDVAVALLDDDTLERARADHPLTTVMPLIRQLLVENAADAGLLVAVSDAAGRLLYVEGASRLRGLAEAMRFLPGADWSEASAGTNAPGTALVLNRPVQLLGPEHLARQVTPWSCSAAPIHDPQTGAILGMLDVTGDLQVATPYAMALVRATVAAAEAELRIAALNGPPPPASPRAVHRPRLEVLGRHAGVLRHGSTVLRLPLRASDLLLVLLGEPDGLTAAELALALSDDDQAAVTARVEVSRVRGLIAPLQLSSRPYRLITPLRCDIAEVRDALRAGQVRRAVTSYVGPVLPASVAPAVVELREDLHGEVRASVLACADADAVLGFADTAHGHDDHPVWAHALEVLPAGSPRRPQVEAHLAALDIALS